jgi:hypothetical protein
MDVSATVGKLIGNPPIGKPRDALVPDEVGGFFQSQRVLAKAFALYVESV